MPNPEIKRLQVITNYACQNADNAIISNAVRTIAEYAHANASEVKVIESARLLLKSIHKEEKKLNKRICSKK